MDFNKIKQAQHTLAKLTHKLKVKVLEAMAQNLIAHTQEILDANAKDLTNSSHLNSAMKERLALDEAKIKMMAKSIQEIASLPNPLGQTLKGWKNESGLEIKKVSVPIGVIAIIYESRPNVTSDSSCLCFKSGNVCILKGGKEAKESNTIIAKILQNTLESFSLPKECINILEDYSKESVLDLIKQDQYIDLLIPRGGERLISFVSQNATVPVLKHDKGICHLYVHKDSKIDEAIEIIINAKTQRPSACNCIETLLIHKDIAPTLLPPLFQALKAKKTYLKVTQEVQNLLKEDLEILRKEDFDKEYGENILNIAISKDLRSAIDHINTHGSKHSESILTKDIESAEIFLNEVDASCVYLNASTRFSDGGEFGFGAEIGISTNKLHARGPIGLEGLVTYKYKIYGNWQVRE
ncbi:glutamate-5-semialdehyde dehydrogenase [Helicobacter cholecystus]|uniref:Gamma-glutamyl phosphate reductase n=1 Tax=Helicobacter cholecystus TaxID=45498 RepID=A0A3D8IW18_9HELI|nr:glutamate-5-semialdehyde dehydrogenase [Helicobacter cholecystus]RDU69223.1 glutamate-5-semialdehyde dehydrogenase [Helicobacter cholecystus]VEJ24298.1 gamma-glutamyl phosphate reductase [Helicobacter cholecystus]